MHNEVESFGVAYLVKQASGDLVLSEDTMFTSTTNDRDVEDPTSLLDNEGFIDEMIEVPATSEDLQTFHGAAMDNEEEEEDKEEEGIEEAIITGLN